MSTRKRPQTPAQGANDMLTRIIAKTKSVRNKLFRNCAAESVLDEWDTYLLWIRKTFLRARKRKGGLGRK